MTTSAAAGLISHTRDLHKLAVGSLQELGVRISAWLVGGNAAALVFGFNAAVGGTSCDPIRLAAVLWTFALGLGCAFAGVIASMIAGMLTTQLLSTITNLMGRVEMDEINLDRIEARFGPQPEDSILNKSIQEHLGELPELQKQMRPLLAVVALGFLLQLAAAVLFARGTLLPVLDPTLLQSCVG